jgi:hypothetical protein
MPQAVPLHVEVPFDGIGHAAHDEVPQLFTEVLATQAPLQLW